jgi:capsular polysaccharide transport system permease protein
LFNGNDVTRQTPNGTIAERSQKMSAALSSYARSLTFENRSRRNLYRLAGIAPKFRDKFFSHLLAATFIIIFVMPIVASAVYFSFFATPQYVSEVRFVVRSSVPLLTRDRFSSSGTDPKSKIVQDTAVILNYLSSPAIVEDMLGVIDLNEIYGRLNIDFFSRLRAGEVKEEVLDYWEKHYDSWVSPKSGIVELKVFAFSGKEAKQMLQTVLSLAERRVNELNKKMWANLTKSASEDLKSAKIELESLRVKMRDMQNESGVFSVDISAESLAGVLTSLRTELATLNTRRATLSNVVYQDSPKMILLDREITALETQVQALQRQFAGSSGRLGGSLADFSKSFSQLELDINLAENRLKTAVAELEKAKLVGTLQLVYIDSFTTPTLPHESSYPKTWLALLLSFLLFAALWGVVAGVIFYIRRVVD